MYFQWWQLSVGLYSCCAVAMLGCSDAGEDEMRLMCHHQRHGSIVRVALI